MGFFSSFTGSDQRRRAKESHATNVRYLDAAGKRSDAAYDDAVDRFAPYDDGGQAYTTYQDALGLNGAPAQSTAQSTIFDDPAYQRISEMNTNKLLRRFNAGGNQFSGAAIQGANRLGLEQYDNRLNRLRDLGGQGLGIASTIGGLGVEKANQRNAFELGKANSFANQQSAVNQAGTLGVNNLFKLGELAVKAASGGIDPTSLLGQAGFGG